MKPTHLRKVFRLDSLGNEYTVKGLLTVFAGQIRVIYNIKLLIFSPENATIST